MKKNNIFKHELNESIQASVALNCLKNRNTPKKLNESADFDTRFHHRSDLKKLANPVTKKAYMLLYNEFGDNMWRQLGIDDADEQTLIDLLNDMQQYSNNPRDIADFMLGRKSIRNFKQEQEELTVNYSQLADDVCASYRGTLSKLDLKDSINYIVKMVAKKIGKTVDTLSPQELTAIQKAAKHSVWYVSEQEELTVEQEEDTLKAYYSQDEPDYENDHHGIWLIINLMRKQGLLRAQGIEGRDDVDDGHAIDAAYDLIEQKLDDEGMWIGDDDHEAERFVSFFGEEIAAEAMKSAIHNQEQEEMPQMERHDIILALSEYMSESWIDTGDEGDLDDVYYAIADILDKTGDYPASTDWKDCKPWCQKHYKEVEAKIY